MTPANIYLDNQSTTRTDPRVVQAMLPFLDCEYANPANVQHEAGLTVAQAIEDASETIAKVLNCWPHELIYTSGATESNFLALRGICHPGRKPGHLISVATEHPSVLEVLSQLKQEGYRVTLLPVHSNDHPQAGRIDLDRLVDSFRNDTIMVSIMFANNEIGVIQPISEIAKICRQRNCLLHTDATQAIGNWPVQVHELDVDLLSFSAHKFYGPKGIGGLFVRMRDQKIPLVPMMTGGGQQRGLRGGTLNVPAIVGMARALEICQHEIEHDELTRRFCLRDKIYHLLCAYFGDLPINGPDWRDGSNSFLRLHGNLNCQFPGWDQEDLLIAATDVALSTGAACRASGGKPSHVLQALGLSPNQIRNSLRISVGRFNTDSEVTEAARRISKVWQRSVKS